MKMDDQAWSLFDRYAPKYAKPVEGTEVEAHVAEAETLWFFYHEDQLLARPCADMSGPGKRFLPLGEYALPLGGQAGDWVDTCTGIHPMGIFAGHPCCVVQAVPDAGRHEPDCDGTEIGMAEGFAWKPLRDVLPLLDGDAGFLAGRALQILNWRRNNRFCGRCGAEMEPRSEERAMSCPKCGFLQYPRLSPAIIVAVTKGENLLLAHNNHFPAGRYSLVAGFVEPGETFEDCVAREVEEEIGIQVGHIRYLSSQPWPFPDSLMIGFTAEWASEEIRVDDVEIGDAKWFGRDAMPDIPGPHTIAGRIIRKWLDGTV